MLLICLIFSVVPGIWLLLMLNKMDFDFINDKTMLRGLLLGGMAAVFAAMLIETIGDEILLEIYAEDSVLYNFWDCFVVTALTEEALKLMVLISLTKSLRYYADDFKPVKYAVYASMGFAILENFFYALDGDIWVVLLRMILCLPGHGMYGVFMGDYYYKYYESGKKIRYAIMMLLIPVIQHGLYDFCVGSDNDLILGFTLIYNAFLYKITYDRIKVLSAHSYEENYYYNQLYKLY